MARDKYGNTLRHGDPVSVVSGHSEYFGEYVGEDRDGIRIRVPEEFGGGETSVPRSKVTKKAADEKPPSGSAPT